MGLAGVAVFAVALFVPSEEGQSNASGLRPKDSQQEPMDLAVSARLDSIIRSTRLQRPLVDPPKKEKKSKVVRQSPNVPWPSLKLTGIFVGDKSTRAVFDMNQKAWSCSEGESFGKVKVVEIKSDSVKLEFKGQTRVEKLGSASSGSRASKAVKP